MTGLRWVVLHGLQTCIQIVLDVSTHLLTATSGGTPRDYRGTIVGLGASGVITPALAAKMAPMAGLRNVLVHGYAAVDLQIVARVPHERLGEFTEFARTVVAYLATTGSAEV